MRRKDSQRVIDEAQELEKRAARSAKDRILEVALGKLGAAQRGEIHNASLGRVDCAAILVHVQELRRDLGAARALVERTKARRQALVEAKQEVRKALKTLNKSLPGKTEPL